MKMIIGGANQGKLDYAKKLYPEVSWVDGRECDMEDAFRTEGIYHFEEYIRRTLETEGNVDNLAATLIEKNPNAVFVSNEVGYGIVPLSAEDRVYRIAVGRVCTDLAAASDKVDRVVCGIGVRIKG